MFVVFSSIARQAMGAVPGQRPRPVAGAQAPGMWLSSIPTAQAHLKPSQTANREKNLARGGGPQAGIPAHGSAPEAGLSWRGRCAGGWHGFLIRCHATVAADRRQRCPQRSNVYQAPSKISLFVTEALR